MLVALLACGCEEHKTPPSATSTTLPVLGSADPVGSSSARALGLGSTAAPTSASAVGSADAADGSGAWTGAYDAKKSSIALPSKAKPDALGADDGKAVVGPGTIELTVDSMSEVRGKIAGSLGPGTLTGRIEGGILRASIRPDDPRAARAMTGVLVGVLKGEAILCDLHAAGPDGGSIRESAVQLNRKR